MFESNYTCHFFRLWGYEEGKKGIALQDALLGNMQNDFDAKLGDVCSEVGSRYFIIEFKTDRKGFAKEISPSGKVHRAHLYQHLRNDQRCRSIAHQGHFGAYADDLQQLIFEPYAHCPAAIQSQNEIVMKHLLGEQKTWHEMDYQDWSVNFNKFYTLVAEAPSNLIITPSGLFEKGLGITKFHLEEYINCMYQHLEVADDDTGESVLGAFSPSTGKFVAFKGSIGDLVSTLHRFFSKMKLSQTSGPTFRSTEPGI